MIRTPTSAPFLVVLVLGACLFSACTHEALTFTLNPDGTGKIDFQIEIPLFEPVRVPNYSEIMMSPEQRGEAMLEKIVATSTGIVVWENLAYRFDAREDAEWLILSGTGYFTDISLVHLSTMEGAPDYRNSFFFRRQGEHCALRLVVPDEVPTPAQSQPMVPAEEIDYIAKRYQEGYYARLGMVRPFLAQAKMLYRFHLPGTIAENNGFLLKDNAIQLTISMQQLLQATTTLAGDLENWKDWIRSGRQLSNEPPFHPRDVFLEYFKNRPPFIVTRCNDRDTQFSYSAAIEKAQAAWPELARQLRIETPREKPFSTGATMLGNVRVIATQHQREAFTNSHNYKVNPFYRVTLCATIPDGRVLKVLGGRLQSAITRAKEDLLPRSEWERLFTTGEVSLEGDQVQFSVDLTPPVNPNAEVSKIVGEVNCAVPGVRKTFDLGLISAQTGKQSKPVEVQYTGFKFDDSASPAPMHLLVELVKLQPHPQQANKHFAVFRIRTDRTLLADTILLENPETNAILETTSYHAEENANGLLVQSIVVGEMPSSLRIKLVVFDEMKKHSYPFVLQE